MSILIVEIPGLPKTTNALNARCHWAIKHQHSKFWKEQVGRAILATGFKIPKEPYKRAKLRLTRFSSSSPDFDGLVSSFKAPLDSLVEMGILENDRFENIGAPEYIWEKCKRGAGKIRIEVIL